MSGSDISIIIVNWNTKNYLLDCLKSLAAGVGRMTYEIWVVDNASTDGSPEAVENFFPEVKLLKNLDNVGFARANNQAAQFASGRFLFFLNPDTITTAGAIESLVAYADEHPDIGILGPRILNPDHSLQRSAWREYPGIRNAIVDALYLWKFPWLPFAHSNEYTRQDLAKPHDVKHLLGASLLVRQQTWAQVGPFDENYFLFLEETELCYQARRKGWRIVYNPKSEIIHYGRQSVIQRPYESYPHLYRSYCRFYRKNNPSSRAGLYVIKIIIAMACFIRILIWALRSLFSANPDERRRSLNISRGYCHTVFELGGY
jgi:GT2 family glycosyltransferase